MNAPPHRLSLKIDLFQDENCVLVAANATRLFFAPVVVKALTLMAAGVAISVNMISILLLLCGNNNRLLAFKLVPTLRISQSIEFPYNRDGL